MTEKKSLEDEIDAAATSFAAIGSPKGLMKPTSYYAYTAGAKAFYTKGVQECLEIVVEMSGSGMFSAQGIVDKIEALIKESE